MILHLFIFNPGYRKDRDVTRCHNSADKVYYSGKFIYPRPNFNYSVDFAFRGKCNNMCIHSTFQAITGMAIDNHLLGLREIAHELKIEKPEIFKDEAYLISNQFILSTSQVKSSLDLSWTY